MAQAKRIRPKAKKKPSPTTPWFFTWQTVVVIGCVLIIGGLLYGAYQGNDSIGAGLRAMFNNDDSSASPAPTQSLRPERSQKEFDFYDKLRDTDNMMPSDLPDSAPNSQVDYYLQAASLKSLTAADALKAQLALQGYKSVIEVRRANSRDTYYRLRLGPFANKQAAQKVVNELQGLGTNPFVYSTKNAP